MLLFSLFCLYIFLSFLSFHYVFVYISVFFFCSHSSSFVLCSFSPVTSVTVLLYALDKGRVKLLSAVRGGALRYKPEGRGFDGDIGIFH
jgi:hypothetical protein